MLPDEYGSSPDFFLAGDIPCCGTAENCASLRSCHGFDGIGENVDIPNIAGQSCIYFRNQLRAFRSGQRKHSQMAISAELATP